MIFNRKEYIKKEIRRIKEAGIVDSPWLKFKRRFVYTASVWAEIWWTENVYFYNLLKPYHLDLYHGVKDEINSYLNQDFRNPAKRKGFKIGDIYLDDFDSYEEFSKAIVNRFKLEKEKMWLSEEWLDYIFVREQRHKWHIVSPSPWPFILSFTIFSLVISAYSLLYRIDNRLIWISLILVIVALFFWFKDIVREAVLMGYHTIQVQDGLRLAFTLFLASEVMFFFSFFWAYFQIAISPSMAIGSVWPPQGICNFFFSNNINQFSFMSADNKFFFSKPLFDYVASPYSEYHYNFALNADNAWLEKSNIYINDLSKDSYLDYLANKTIEATNSYYSLKNINYILLDSSLYLSKNILSPDRYDFIMSFCSSREWIKNLWSQDINEIFTVKDFYLNLIENKNFFKFKKNLGLLHSYFPIFFYINPVTGKLIALNTEILSFLPAHKEYFVHNLNLFWDIVSYKNLSDKLNYTLTYKHFFKTTVNMGFTHEIFKILDQIVRNNFELGESFVIPKRYMPSIIFTVFNEGVLINPFKKPLLNTLILLTSGATITISHKLLKLRSYQFSMIFLQITIILSYLFLTLQFMEYCAAGFSLNDGIYGSLFFVLTGFHGLHVIIGSIFLSVSFYRFTQHHFTPAVHLGFEFAIWYWHFVDVVWLFLYFALYLWPNSYFFLFSNVNVFPSSASFAAQINLNSIMDVSQIFKYHVNKFDWDTTRAIIGELLDNRYIAKRFVKDVESMEYQFVQYLADVYYSNPKEFFPIIAFDEGFKYVVFDIFYRHPFCPYNSYEWFNHYIHISGFNYFKYSPPERFI